MSRYDGLIIPRSYSEYINKTDAATLQQALQLSGVLSAAVAAGDNKAVKSSAVNNALSNQRVIDCNEAVPNGSTVKTYIYNGESNNDTHLPTQTSAWSNYGILTTRTNVDEQNTIRADQLYIESGESYVWRRTGYRRLNDTEFSWADWDCYGTNRKNDILWTGNVNTPTSITLPKDITSYAQIIILYNDISERPVYNKILSIPLCLALDSIGKVNYFLLEGQLSYMASHFESTNLIIDSVWNGSTSENSDLYITRIIGVY